MIGLVLDSTVRLTAADEASLREVFGDLLRRVDLTVIVAEGEGRADSDVDADEVCAAMSAGSTVRTSMPSTAAFADAIGEVLDAGADGVLVITLSSRLSGTYDAACAAAAQVMRDRGLGGADGSADAAGGSAGETGGSAGETGGSAGESREIPEGAADEAPVRVVDSLTAGSGAVGLAHWAAAFAESEVAEAAAALESAAAKFSATFFVPATLEHLHRGGRIGGAAALFGRALKIVPVLRLSDGRVEPVARVRTAGKAAKRAVDEAAAAAEQMRTLDGAEGLRAVVTVLHPEGSPEDASPVYRSVLAAAEDKWDEVETAVLSTVITAHVGPGAAGIEVRLMP